MTDPTPENIAQTVAKLMATMEDTTVIEPRNTLLDGPLLLSVPAGRQIQDHTKAIREMIDRIKPFARKGTATMQNLQGIIDWANRFKGANSVLFANNHGKPSLTCIADYHVSGAPKINAEGEDTARHCQHRATYAFPLSRQWAAWMEQSAKAISGQEMGIFLENNILDVIDPPLSFTSPGIAGAEATEADLRLIQIAQKLEGSYGNASQLLQMASSFAVYESSEFVEQRNTTTGEATLQHKSEHLDGTGRPIRVPKLFLVAIPVFENGPAYRLPVRFQYRKSGPQVKFILTLHDPKHALDHAFTEAVDAAACATELPVFLGSPEA